MGLPYSKPFVLVVDDEPLIRMYAVEVMEDAGFTVVEAESGPAALLMLEAHPGVTVLFSDIQMPGEFDGLALARKIFASRPDIWLIMTSGNVTPAAGEIPGEGQFVAKPYDGEVVARMIADLHA